MFLLITGDVKVYWHLSDFHSRSTATTTDQVMLKSSRKTVHLCGTVIRQKGEGKQRHRCILYILHVFGLWEETKAPGVIYTVHSKNIYRPHRKSLSQLVLWGTVWFHWLGSRFAKFTALTVTYVDIISQEIWWCIQYGWEQYISVCY